MKWARNTTLSWGPGVGMIYPASGSRCTISVAKYPGAQSFVMWSSLMVEATHLPPAPDMFGYAEKAWTRALELEEARMD